jgi:hypothetical protein
MNSLLPPGLNLSAHGHVQAGGSVPVFSEKRVPIRRQIEAAYWLVPSGDDWLVLLSSHFLQRLMRRAAPC